LLFEGQAFESRSIKRIALNLFYTQDCSIHFTGFVRMTSVVELRVKVVGGFVELGGEMPEGAHCPRNRLQEIETRGFKMKRL